MKQADPQTAGIAGQVASSSETFGKGDLLRNEPQYPTKGYAPHFFLFLFLGILPVGVAVAVRLCGRGSKLNQKKELILALAPAAHHLVHPILNVCYRTHHSSPTQIQLCAVPEYQHCEGFASLIVP